MRLGITLDHGRAQGALTSIVGDLHRTRERHKGQKLIASAAKLALEVMRQITAFSGRCKRSTSSINAYLLRRSRSLRPIPQLK